MGEYNHQQIEKKWQQEWINKNTYQVKINKDRPKFYALDMFPYPSGAGLHVGHPLGYIATDIVSRYKRLKGFNVLHPMGFDAFGLPAEQYAIQTGQHPAITTETNIKRYKEQLKNLGFSYDWSREVRTSDPSYYKWTQWIFKQLFNSWYNKDADKAEAIDTLIKAFEASGNSQVNAVCDEDTPAFSASEWKSWSEETQQRILLKYRLTYIAETTVNWCPALGTVLSNDEVKDGFSERGGHPVIKKKMAQWSMRITAYADRLLSGLDQLDWPEPIKDMQRNWIGKSFGAEVDFQVENSDRKIRVFTTRIDTIYGVSFMVLAPESDIVPELTTLAQKQAIEEYVAVAKNRSERDRMSDVKTISGVFTGSYVINPFNNEKVPVWIADYVLAGYGTGAVMAVPSGDQRDFDFAKHFDLPIIQIIDQQKITDTEADPTKEGKMINSGMLNGLSPLEAIQKANEYVIEKGIGTPKVNYKIRDAIFGRQRYWGEPIPVYFKNDIPYLVDDEQLPLELPEVDKFLPTEDGEPPLGRAENWSTKDGHPYELTTMPGWAGSSWYFFRYMDPENDQAFAGKEALDYWKEVDFYMGGSEHATGHLLYSRFWTKFLFDLGYIKVDEYAKKLVNQGMIQGVSEYIQLIRIDPKYEQKYDRCSKEIIITTQHGKKCLIKVDSWKENEHNHIYLSKDLNLDININILEGEQKIPVQIVKVEDRADIQYVNQTGEKSFLEVVKWFNNQPVYAGSILIGRNGYWKGKNCYDYDGIELSNSEVKIYTRSEVEKMSKSKLNVKNPDDLIEKYGADTLRMYEMFLGPVEQSKPWNTNGIEGVFKFLKKFWALFHDQGNQFKVSEESPTPAELKILHGTIKKIEDDIERLSLNTSVSNFMIATNELSSFKCNKRAILEPFVVLLAPYAPHIAEELWSLLGHSTSVCDASFPVYEEKYLKEDSKEYPIMINGKMRTKISFASDATKEEVEKAVAENEVVQKWLEGKPPKKVIFVPNKIVNVVA